MIHAIWLTFYTMLTFGLFGGVVSFFLNWDLKQDWKFFLLKCIAVGEGASFLVPIFLHLISSKILEGIQSNWSDYLVFCGLCLTASIFSSRFIQTVGEKVIKKLEKVERESEETSKIIETIVEYAVQESPTQPLTKSELKIAADIQPKAISVLQLLYNPNRMVLRTTSSLAQDLKLSVASVNNLLSQLLENKFIRTLKLRDGKTFWAITPKGKAVAEKKK